MNPGRPKGRGPAVAAAVLLGAGGAAVGAMAGQQVGAAVGATVGAAAAGLWHARRERRATARRRLLALPFPDRWRDLLRERYDHYHRLPPDWRARFEADLRLFAAETRVTGVGVEVTEELRLLVAASAVTLSLGWPEFEWDHLAEVLLYPQDFDRDYNLDDPELSGQAHGWGTVILSVPALRESFADPDDGYHVGLHEFAHLLDVEQSDFDGVPAGLGEAQSQAWIAVAEKELDRVRRGKSVLDEYASEGPAELLAVAVESFFESPLLLRQRHRELYGLLAGYFRQDPAAWDDARGLYL